jgi:hypothetical protein
MFIVHCQTNVLHSLQLVIKKYKCKLEFLFWVLGIMFSGDPFSETAEVFTSQS